MLEWLMRWLPIWLGVFLVGSMAGWLKYITSPWHNVGPRDGLDIFAQYVYPWLILAELILIGLVVLS
jgi:hypothetical protein